jgi:uncharacterized protein
MFVDRDTELAFLNRVLARQQHPGPGQLVMLYGRRRLGKTTLLRHWAEASGVPFTHWVAEQAPAGVQRRSLYAQLLGREPTQHGVTFESWSDIWQIVALAYQTERRIIILDELPYAAEADPAMLSALQLAWDQHFERSQAMIVLCGSHVRTMALLMAYSSPLYGRMTGQWCMQPLPFSALRALLPGWPADQQVAMYALVGGVPAYLSWFRADRSLLENVRDGMLAPGSLALDEPLFLLSDELREPRAYLAILAAIGMGCHTFKAIKDGTLLGDVHLPAYLSTLQELHFVERRLPITIPPVKQRISRQGRYHLSDPFLRFYFRFLHPHRDVVSYAPDRILPSLERGLRAFIEQTVWADLARQWVRQRGHQGGLPFVPEVIGSHWSRLVQVPVVAISWTEQAILIGECRWGDAAVDQQTVRDLIDRIVPLTVADLPDKGIGWQVVLALFARVRVTPAARKTLTEAGGIVVDLPRLFADLAEA